jgi:hypothetical protein
LIHEGNQIARMTYTFMKRLGGSPWRRTRGALLRLVLGRRGGVLLGLALLAPAAALWLADFEWESWMTDGAALVLGATGAAFLLGGLGGRRPDWVE